MQNAERYSFTVADPTFGAASLRPYLPITLTYQGKSITSSGLLDTGAAVNVLPHELGIELGAVWEQATTLAIRDTRLPKRLNIQTVSIMEEVSYLRT